MKLLIVDDLKMIRDVLTEAMSEIEEIETIVTADGVASALRVFREVHPDLVLLDMHLQDGDGLDVLRAIRAERPATQVVVLTRFPEYRDQCEALAVERFFDKADGLESVIDAIRSMARSHKRTEH
ncbi:MAG: response regulator transcription factor [Sulfuricella sp.]